jgi:hypothetical protein
MKSDQNTATAVVAAVAQRTTLRVARDLIR